MKSCHFSHPLVLALGLALLPLAGASGVTFSSNTLISPNNTNFDGADIVVTNCTVTVDGAHSFASFQVQNGGVLTASTQNVTPSTCGGVTECQITCQR